MENKITIYQQFKAPHDQNGNPARLWVGYDDQGQIVQVWDEGYSGKPEDLRRYPGPAGGTEPVELPAVNITRGEYKRMRRTAQDGDYLVEQS